MMAQKASHLTLTTFAARSPSATMSSLRQDSTQTGSHRQAAWAWRWPNGSLTENHRSTCGQSMYAASPSSTATISGFAIGLSRLSASIMRYLFLTENRLVPAHYADHLYMHCLTKPVRCSGARWAGNERITLPVPGCHAR